ncbi:hypothetical protein FE257_011715 [Aspergillus nanangensis]|uniref:Arrestin-like N-terminal domain-containing protein n=1 Tax=Aspergillus nanangensis TaxID=2582783 RepID=A0AAD4CV43_ASPNN|nr:hypothetical protein FE257_011715 [Aspergillus nanangensis]
MSQPLDSLPWMKVDMLEEGVQYQIPFNFVVPSEIPHQLCKHPYRHAQIFHEHLKLPPSMSSKSTYNGKTNTTLDSMAPRVVSVSYRLHFRVGHKRDKTTKNRVVTVGEWTHLVHINSPRVERAPVLLLGDSSFYRPYENSYFIQGLRRRRLGQLSAQAAQPVAVYAPNLVTNIQISLQFKSSSGNTPPGVVSIHSKLNAITAYSHTPWQDFPDMTDPVAWDPSKEYYKETRSLGVSINTLNWEQYLFGDNESDAAYRAILTVPIRLPDHLVYLPSFHSCLVSRFYSLKVAISHHLGRPWASSSKLSLTVPIQIL